MTAPRFAVVGSGGSGTAYMARLFRMHWLRCGHEQWWTLLGHPVPGLDGDSSWLAVPDIEAGMWSGPVLHVTRHPVAVTRNILGGGIFSDRVRYPRYRDFALEHEPDLAGMPPLEAAVEWWVRWNARCAAVADLTVAVEDVPRRLGRIGEVVGRTLHREIVDRIPRNINHRTRTPVADADVWRLLDGRHTYGYRESACV